MKVMLLGHNGQLGSDLKATAAEYGVSFQAIDRKDLDVQNSQRLTEILQDSDFDVLVNCTSFHKTDDVERQASEAFAVNAFAVRSMAEICRSKSKRFVHFSTDYVFGADARRASPLVETDPAAPVNVYGASKVLGENFIKLSNCDHLIIRVASLFGVSGASGKGGNFVETMIDLASKRQTLKVVNDQVMSPTNTKDVSNCVWSLLKQNAAIGTYHIVNSGKASWYEFAAAIFAKTNSTVKLESCSSHEYRTAALRPNYSVLSNEKAVRKIGQIRHWDEALHDYLVEKGHLSRKTP